MPVFGFGVDIVSVNRIRRLREKYADNFLKRIFTENEIRTCLATKHPDEMLAARFAAKEAVMKSLKAGLFTGLHFKDIEIEGGSGSQPTVRLHEKAIRAAVSAGATKVLVSLSHERDYAVAMVVVSD